MSISRKEKPNWFKLLDRIKAIIEVGMGDAQDLANFVGVARARPYEWLSGKGEPLAEKTILIAAWVSLKESQISAIPSKGAAYKKALANVGKS